MKAVFNGRLKKYFLHITYGEEMGKTDTERKIARTSKLYN